MSDVEPRVAEPRPFAERRAIMLVLAVVMALLGAAYYVFLRPSYEVLYTSLRPADASGIVSQLDALGVQHKLANGGTTILVPSSEADNARVRIAGTDGVTKAGAGFELFNHSDMGLTDFAQKINYQRALQGELARTIMTMDGIESARVHLALPEHTLFRSTQSPPKAAIEISMRLGSALTPDRVAGMRQLVAAGVPDLAIDNVVILDGEGRVLSATPATPPHADTEQAALQDFYAARARSALRSALPGFPAVVRAIATSAPTDIGEIEQPGAIRVTALRVTVTTEHALEPHETRAAQEAVTGALTLGSLPDDDLRFEIGPVEQRVSSAAPQPYPVKSAPAFSETVAPDNMTPSMQWSWGVVVAAAVAVVTLALALRSRRKRADSPLLLREDAPLLERLRHHLALTEQSQ